MAQKQKKKVDHTAQRVIIKKVLRYLGRYRIFLWLSLALAFMTVALQLYIPKLTGEVVDFMIGAGSVQFAGVIGIIIKIAVSAMLAGLGQWLMNLCNNKMTYDVVRDIRNDAFHKIEQLPLSYIDLHPYGEIESRVIADADQFADGLLMGFTQLFTGVITILGTLCFMLSINIGITIAVVALTPLSFLVAGYISTHTYTMFRKQAEIRGKQTGLINEMVEGQKVVKAFNRRKEVVREFDGINEELKETSLRAIFFSSITNPATRFVNSLVYAVVGVTGALAAITGHLTVGQLTAFLSYASQYAKPFNEISGVVTELQNAIACAGRVLDLIEEEPQVPDSEQAKAPEHFDGRVELQKVDFSYTEGQELIRDFNLQVKPGQKIAIVGPTGCGKTTLINLLMRFYDVKGGAILVDGTDVREITRHSLRSGYGMVLQETWLKSGTIRENITMGNPDITEEEMIRIAKTCHIDSFIRRLPKGYDTVVSENGEDFSQGQRQLLCIARVMMSRPSMLILDEATSSIDTRTELKIQDAFNKMMEGKTSFIVAHRLSTIRHADCILVMKEGRIIEQGTHDCL
ncbi:MAG: ABC transporter ATP-binding protein/permease, partial [Firmicutes bacterium]|nr:ABC transporter ATP-binding protein/permease [Bacillota bacterium]